MNGIITAYLLARSVLKVGWRLAMVRGDVEGRKSRLLASLATYSTISTSYLLAQVNPVGGMRASRSRGKGGGGLNKEA